MRLGAFIQRIFCEPDGTPSNKRLIATYATFVYSVILMTAFFYTVPLNEAVIHMADVLLGTSMGTYVVGRFAEKQPIRQLESEGEPEIPEEPKKTKKDQETPSDQSEGDEESKQVAEDTEESTKKE